MKNHKIKDKIKDKKYRTNISKKKENKSVKRSIKGGEDQIILNFDEGPLDTAVHSVMNKPMLEKHVNEMEKKKSELEQQRERIQNRINAETQSLASIKSQDEAKLAAEEDKLHQQKINDDNNAREEHVRSVETFNKFVWSIISIFKTILEYASRIIAFIISLIFLIFFSVKELLDSIFNGTFVNSLLFPIVCYVLALLFFLAVIIGIIILIVYGISLITKKNDESASKIQNDIIPTTININLQDIFSTEYVNQLLESSKKINVNHKPYFDQIKNYTFDFLSTPFESIKNFFSYIFDAIINSPLVSDNIKHLRSINGTFNSMVYGEDEYSYSPAIPETSGRPDNIFYVDASLFSDVALLNKKKISGIDTSKTVINIAKPNDIEWNLPVITGSDIYNLPLSVRNKKNNYGISLLDKKNISIPWIEKDNYYELSCQDAYFKSNDQNINMKLNNEKANILKDNDDNTCRFNIDVYSKIFNKTEQRYLNANDLSNYI